MEKNVYYELQKYINKDQDINVLIGSFYPEMTVKCLIIKLIKYYMINSKMI